MKIGMRKPSFKRSLKARTTGKLKRAVKKAVIPGYGQKGMGLITNPKKSLYNRVYSKTSFSIWDLFSTKKKNGNSTTGFTTILLYLLFFPFIMIYWIIKLYILIIKYCYIGIKKIIDSKNGKSLLVLLLVLIFPTGCDYIVIEDNNQNENNTINEKEELNTETENDEETDKIGIWSDEYLNLVYDILKKSTEDNKYLKYTRSTLYNPYIQVNIEPTGKYDKAIIEQEAKKIAEFIINELQKYKYDDGGFWSSGYEYINIYFHDYDSYGKLYRNGGPFVQIEIMDIHNITIDSVFDKN